MPKNFGRTEHAAIAYLGESFVAAVTNPCAPEKQNLVVDEHLI